MLRSQVQIPLGYGQIYMVANAPAIIVVSLYVHAIGLRYDPCRGVREIGSRRFNDRGYKPLIGVRCGHSHQSKIQMEGRNSEDTRKKGKMPKK